MKPISIEFSKIQAQGNSYIYIDCIEQELPNVNLSKLARFVSDRHRGIGSDGMVILLPDDEADTLMRIWNADGSEAETCGTALRSVMLLLYKKDNSKKRDYKIRIGSEIIQGSIIESDDKFQTKVTFKNLRMILLGHNKDDDAVENLINIDRWIGLPVSVGNPHFVIIDRFQDYSADITHPDLIQTVGPMIHHEGTFPDGVNVELVKIINPRKVEVRVWERGTGETLACGSGACAVAYAGQLLGFLDTEVDVKFPGGTVTINLNDKGTVCSLIGPVTQICNGILEYPFK